MSVFVNRDKTDEFARMLEKFPRLSVVIDHGLIPKPIADLGSAVAEMIRLAKFSNAYAKLSFVPLGSVEEYPSVICTNRVRGSSRPLVPSDASGAVTSLVSFGRRNQTTPKCAALYA